jgi:hypothetical protein
MGSFDVLVFVFIFSSHLFCATILVITELLTCLYSTSAVLLNTYLTLLSMFATDFLFRGYDDPLDHPTPIPCHSHNDYWRSKPVYSALEAGCIGIEADLWLYKDDLYVAHEWSSIRPNKTFTEMYVKPLVEILDRRNAQLAGYGSTPNGVYVSAPEQTLILLIDIKGGSEQMWPWVLHQLDPLRKRGWLSYVDRGFVRYGPITIVASGNSRFYTVMKNSTFRDVFFDAPLSRLSEGIFDSSNSLYASAHFRKAIGLSFTGKLSGRQLAKIRSQVREAHDKNLLVRYWSQPSWPTVVRNRIWKSLVEEGVDIINVDDVEGFREAWDSGWLRRGKS